MQNKHLSRRKEKNPWLFSSYNNDVRENVELYYAKQILLRAEPVTGLGKSSHSDHNAGYHNHASPEQRELTILTATE